MAGQPFRFTRRTRLRASLLVLCAGAAAAPGFKAARSPRSAEPSRSAAQARTPFPPAARPTGQKRSTERVQRSPVVADQDTFVYGLQPAGTVIRHHFTLHNVSAQPVRIQDLQMSCSCMNATFTPSVLQPGGAGVVTVSFLPPFDLRGSYEDTKEVYVRLQGYSGAAVGLRMTGTIHCAVLADPAAVEFGHVPSGTQQARTVTLHLDTQSRLAVQSLRGLLPDGLRATLSPLQKLPDGRREQRIRVTLSSDCPVGEQSGKLLLHTNDPRVPPLELPVSAAVDSPFEADPDTLFFGVVPAGQERRKSVRIRACSGAGAHVRSLLCRNPYLTPEIHAQDGLVELRVRLSPDAPRGEIHSQVKLQLDPGNLPVTVPISAYVR